MIYKFRIWLSAKLFILGKKVHPDIARLTAEIVKQQEQMSAFKLGIK